MTSADPDLAGKQLAGLEEDQLQQKIAAFLFGRFERCRAGFTSVIILDKVEGKQHERSEKGDPLPSSSPNLARKRSARRDEGTRGTSHSPHALRGTLAQTRRLRWSRDHRCPELHVGGRRRATVPEGAAVVFPRAGRLVCDGRVRHARQNDMSGNARALDLRLGRRLARRKKLQDGKTGMTLAAATEVGAECGCTISPPRNLRPPVAAPRLRQLDQCKDQHQWERDGDASSPNWPPSTCAG
ncbi:hypothetical protein BDK51DRAFT_38954 [Blyttiomyces helicus]|uniref:Uncharacterized protein n=1 Tax=Blyttiomyces helicus TaxID=388810 RepID=A0A4P9W2K5_9FUNG|nr:hypothetical protein BDK51DRAFT_38954 [Blyttiomyces helicus]|eukprot:RKO86461.1 hypothetical protein BDK51DRAFT_38954 [Blyttiomyces helicus]